MNLKYLRYIHILAYLYAFSSDMTIESNPVADFFAVFHTEIRAKEMRELINLILSEMNAGVQKELNSQDYEHMNIKVIVHINGDSNRSYISSVCPGTSTPRSFDFYWKVVCSYNEKLLNDLYPLLSALADTNRRTLPAIPDLSALAEDLEVKRYGILYNNQSSQTGA